MIETSSCASTLESSLSDAAAVTMAVRSSPARVIADRNPSAIDSTETTTTTTPTMPIIATTDAVNRCGMLRRLTVTIASVCETALNIRSLSRPSRQRFGDPQTACLPRGHRSSDKSETDDQARPDNDVAGTKVECGKQASCGVTATDNHPCRRESRPA